MKKPNARQRLLDAAADLFTERGYGVVGINQIIDKADTAKASFYHHFPSKECLCATWLEDAHDRAEARQMELLESDGSGGEKILRYFELLKTWLTTKDFRGCPYSNTAASLDNESKAIQEQVVLHKNSLRTFFIELAGQDVAGSEEEARKLGTSLFLLYSGAAIEAQNLRSEWPVDAAIECVGDLLDRYEGAAVVGGCGP